MWFHSSPCAIRDGDLVLPASARGIDPVSFGDRLDDARSYEHFRPDLVFVYGADSYDLAREHFGIATWATEDRFIYEVEPISAPQPDPSPVAPDNFGCCPAARVIKCIHRPVIGDKRLEIRSP